jgi:hypothetical protein
MSYESWMEKEKEQPHQEAKAPELFELEKSIIRQATLDAVRALWAESKDHQGAPISPGQEVKEKYLSAKTAKGLDNLGIGIGPDIDLEWAIKVYEKAFRDRYELGYPFREQ